ncbi:MAG: adenine phosphoribosyltransferase [Planctomycetaceae bacterium]|jgi:adenine phosphoribosyltransferase|nr:adenine phosphoribosyltransferase [Planctomycetaceae bacterium]
MVSLTDYIREVPDFPVPGILFYDITTLIQNGDMFREAIRQLAEKVKSWAPIDLIAAPEARGFIFAAPLAAELGAGLIPIRKPGKLPFKTISKSYDLEYGTNTVQMNIDAIQPGKRVLLVDDLLATGGTMEACRQLVVECGGQVIGAAFIIELLFLNGRNKIKMDKIETLIKYEK